MTATAGSGASFWRPRPHSGGAALTPDFKTMIHNGESAFPGGGESLAFVILRGNKVGWRYRGLRARSPCA